MTGSTEIVIESPAALKRLASDLNNEDGKTRSEKKQVRLEILSPLAQLEMFEACQGGEGIWMHGSGGVRLGPSGHRSLQLAPLSSAWRAAWSKFPTEVLEKVTFDTAVTEPQCPRSDTGLTTKVCWFPSSEAADGLDVPYMDFIRIVIAMATVMSMRSGKTVQFALDTYAIKAEMALKKPGRGDMGLAKDERLLADLSPAM